MRPSIENNLLLKNDGERAIMDGLLGLSETNRKLRAENDLLHDLVVMTAASLLSLAPFASEETLRASLTDYLKQRGRA